MAQFITGYLQRSVPFDVVVVGTVTAGTKVTATNREAAILRGDFVKYVAATSTVNPYITKAKQSEVVARTATHIVALTDQTMEDGHVPTDLRDYRSSDLVGSNKTTAPIALTDGMKKVALWPILDWNDVVQDADFLDAVDDSNSSGT